MADIRRLLLLTSVCFSCIMNLNSSTVSSSVTSSTSEMGVTILDNSQELRSLIHALGLNLFTSECIHSHIFINSTNHMRGCVCYMFCDWRTLTDEEAQWFGAHVARMNLIKEIKKGIYITLYAITASVGVAGNLLVLLAVSCFMGRPTITYMMIASMSLSDIFCCMIFTPLQAYYIGNTFWLFLHELGRQTCYLFYTMYIFSLYCSIYSMTAMNIERFIAICYPLKVKALATKGFIKKTLAGVWIVAALMTVPTVYIGVGYYQSRSYAVSECHFFVPLQGTSTVKAVGIVFLATAYLLPVSIIGFCNIRMVNTIVSSVKNMTHMKSSETPTDSDGETQRRVKVAKMLAIVFLVFVLCWGPMTFHRCLLALGFVPSDLRYFDIHHPTNILTILNSAMNPFLYAFSSRHFREAFKMILLCGRKSYITTSKTSGIKTSMASPSPI